MTKFEEINQPRLDGFPKVKEIVAKGVFKTNPKESDYDKPLSALYRKY